MASTAAESNAAKTEVLKDALYEAAQECGSETRTFSQRELLDLNVIPNDDSRVLLQVVQELCNEKLFVGVQDARGGLAWRWRNREDAKKHVNLPDDETRMVYGVIDEAGADGVWMRVIKHRLGMQDSVVKGCIKFLETKGFIASMKNVEHPNKKMYIKANLRPSDRATGGPWFTDGELDLAFIHLMQSIIFENIKIRSAYLSSQSGSTRQPKKGVLKGVAPDEARGKKRAAADMSHEDRASQAPVTPAARPAGKGKTYLPLPAGFTDYPTVREIATLIDASGITNGITLGESDVQQLVDVLVFDGLVEPVRVDGRKGYRVTRATRQDTVPLEKRREEREAAGPAVGLPLLGAPPLANGLMEVPCGRCPVFDLCEEGGPVNPGNCEYYQEWLGILVKPK